jgi:glycosyltransferase involved in cell wall biosynthesis/SAM-dependent methyltransferase
MHACTIIARNYLAHARVLAKSFLQHQAGGRFTALVLDAEDIERPEDEAFAVMSPYDIGLDPAELHRMAMIYDVLEIATAVKPWFLRRLLQDDLDVTYLDPDIRVYAPLDHVSELAREHSIVLVPHMMEPIPRDGRVPSEETILAAGVFNLGFIGVGRRAEPFLDWWSERLARDCFLDFDAGQFVDQRWIDLVPGIFEHVILRDRGADVAHWNVFARDLRRTDEGWQVDGEPLRFYHFTGFDPHRPWLLSRHQGVRPRVMLSERPDLAALCREYATDLLENGYDQTTRTPYRFDRLVAGLPIDKRMRRLYRDELAGAEHNGGELPPDPFDPDDPQAFLTWLNEPVDPVGGAALVSRYLDRLRRERPDLQTAFPDLRWSDAERYLAWVAADGRYQVDLPAELVPDLRGISPRPASLPGLELEPGFNIAGYLRAELGVGEAARQIIEGVKAAGIPYSTVVYDAGTSSRQEHPFEGAGSSTALFDTNLICVNADRLREFAQDMGPDFFRDRYNVGVWWWEVDVFPPALHSSFDIVNEIWVGSDHIAQAIAKETDKPVLTIPIPVRVPDEEPLTRGELGLPDGFLFLFSFDFFSIPERKNPFGLVAAFKRAFPQPNAGPKLVLKSINGDKLGVRLEELRAAAAGRPDILVIDKYVTAREKNSFMSACDCYVSLHRSEGFGLTMAEAMVYGKPVIATGYSGNLEFMTDENSYLVAHTMSSVPAGVEPYPTDAHWAEPDLAHAADIMRHVYENPEEARERGVRAQRDIRERQSPERLGAFIGRRIAEIRELRRAAPQDGVPDAVFSGDVDLAQAAAIISRGPGGVRTGRARAGAPAVLLRRALNRALFPYIAEQHELQRAVVSSINAIQKRVAAIEPQRARADVESTLAELQSLSDRTDELERRQRLIPAHLEEMGAVLARVETDLHQLRSELAAAPFAADPALLRTKDPDGRDAIGFDAGAFGAARGGYVDFEDVFRGSEAMIRERQRVYVPLLRDAGPVLDVGCGRGELLELLIEEGVDAVGIDLDPQMVTACVAKGLPVQHADVLDHLRARPERSLGAVFSAQVIEHLPYESLVEFLRLAQQRLRPGGRLIAETVNPHSIQAFKTFWTDLTHTVPIFPEVAAVLCGIAGFTSAYVMFPNATDDDLEESRRTQGEYAVVATAPDV